jgi:PAT family beta-lactamase induction signal transducer AmpG
MEIVKKQTLSETFSVYLDRRMVRILLLGIISGFPWVLIGSSLSLWLKEDGLSRSTIGWAGLIFGVYAINYLWAPIIDRIRIPWLTNKIGHRRSWIITMQFFILISLVCWSTIDPSANLWAVIAIGLVIAIASATQDITVDALRIEQIGENEGTSMQAGAAMAVVGWWTGYKLGGVVALNTAEYFQQAGVENYWQTTFLILGIIVIACNIGLMFVHELQSVKRQIVQKKTDKFILNKIGSSGKYGGIQIIGAILIIYFIAYFPLSYLGINLNLFFSTEQVGYLLIIAAILGCFLLNVESRVGTGAFSWFSGTISGPFVNFFQRNGLKIALGILGFVFLFKIGEAFLGRMSIVFYKEMGFSKGDIALYSKGIGWITTVVFTLMGGLFAIRSGVVKAMFVSGILMAATNLLFAALAWSGKSELLFAFAVLLDDIAAAFATVAFVAFISLLVDRTYTATQYALLASIGTLGRTTLAASSGELVDWLNGDWGTFFVITTLMVIPSLVCLWFMRNKLKLQ